jgi:transcription elongation factor Elf1
VSDDEGGESGGPGRVYKDFDCPICNANNPLDEPLADGTEVRCFYCGQEFRARITDEGKLKLREV